MRLYVASFGRNFVGYFELSLPPGLTLRQLLTRTDVLLLDTKDIYVTRGGKYSYVTGAFMSDTVSIYSIDADGLLAEAPFSPFELPSARPEGVNVSPESQAFFRLVGY